MNKRRFIKVFGVINTNKYLPLCLMLSGNNTHVTAIYAHIFNLMISVLSTVYL